VDPSDDVAQTAAVMAVLAASEISLDTEGVATSFRQGRRNLAKVEAVVAALSRMGFVTTADGGKTFALRRVA
jgi:phage gp16-like protein